MKAYLLYPDRDFDADAALPFNEADLTQDLGLDIVFRGMSGDDEYLFDVARRVVFASLRDVDVVTYRQCILSDCLAQPDIIRQLYQLAVDTIAGEKKIWGFLSYRTPSSILYRSVNVLEFVVGQLRTLRTLASGAAGRFTSDGFAAFCNRVASELDDEYFAEIQDHLKRLKFRNGVLISAQLGEGNKGVGYVVRSPREVKRSFVDQLAGRNRVPTHTVRIAERDEAGAQALSELQNRGINLVANALGQSTDHIVSFFQMLRFELGFYVGGLNLHEELTSKGEPTCLPTPTPVGSAEMSCRGLYDVSLSRGIQDRVVGNDVAADGKGLIVLTGANTGGKSTLLRAVGLAQLMLQAGMFVGAEAMTASLRTGVYTHYKREEDDTMTSGKLDEELARMSAIADHLKPHAMVLFNESFAATNEREGSEIARQIVRALLERDVRVCFVTHFYDLAHGFYSEQRSDALFLRAERRDDGERTFKLTEGEPLPTSYGADLYERLFGRELAVGG